MSPATNLHHDYLVLVGQFPLRPIRTHRQHNEAMKVLGPLAVTDEGSLRAGQQDYLDVLPILLEDYGRQQVTWLELSGVELLKSLMEARNMTVNQLGQVVGSQPNASLILSGRRSMSTSVMRRLGAHFGLPSGVFPA